MWSVVLHFPVLHFHFVMVCVCGYLAGCLGVYYVRTIKRKPIDKNDLKLGTIVILDSVSKPIDIGFKRSRVKGTGSLFLCGDFWDPVRISLKWSKIDTSYLLHMLNTTNEYLPSHNKLPHKVGVVRVT